MHMMDVFFTSFKTKPGRRRQVGKHLKEIQLVDRWHVVLIAGAYKFSYNSYMESLILLNYHDARMLLTELVFNIVNISE